MRFTSLTLGPLLATVTMASALPEAMPKTERSLQKRDPFDPVRACNLFRPAGGELAIVSTISHNIVFDPNAGLNLGSEIQNGAAIVLTSDCVALNAAEYEPRGGGNGHEAEMTLIMGIDTVKVQVDTLGDVWGIADAKVWVNDQEKEVAFCSGTEHKFEGFDVDLFKVCNFIELS